MSGWVQDWPFECVDVGGVRVLIKGYVSLMPVIHGLRDPIEIGEQGFCYYPYEHARRLDDGSWIFHGAEDFTITPGPPQPPSSN